MTTLLEPETIRAAGKPPPFVETLPEPGADESEEPEEEGEGR
jgi:hypothetical protein